MRDLSHPQGIENHIFSTASHPDAWHGVTEEQKSVAIGLDDVNDLWRSETELRQLLETSLEEDDPARLTLRFAPSEVPPSRQRQGHRKVRRDAVRRKPTRGETLSFVTIVMTAAIMAVVCALGGTVTHDPLRQLAGTDAPRRLADWWPLLVYGPWMVASLSILRAALYQRRAPHSWCVVFLFSAFAIAFCIDQGHRTITGATVASLPTIAAVSCFHQLVRQITLTRPPQRGIASRRTPA